MSQETHEEIVTTPSVEVAQEHMELVVSGRNKETAAERKLKEKELREQIEELAERQKRIQNLQTMYGVPDESLTESDSIAKNTSVEALKKQLETFEGRKEHSSGIGKFVKKIAVFLSL